MADACSAASVVAPTTPPPPLVVGRARRLRSPSPCDVPPFVQGGPGVPYFVVEAAPRAGHPFRVQWSTKPTSPTDMPAWPAMLFVSFEAIAPVPLDAVGAPGCHLQVLPEFVLLPMVDSILTQQGGRVNLDWTPAASLIGQDFYSQLLVFEPGVNGAGFLLSPALHITVGS
ncbi:MAG: hypothetical protein H6835_11975 [Planctomycetes bacterium]|nr:hypothetical protein [Planctomycetota bacterium]